MLHVLGKRIVGSLTHFPKCSRKLSTVHHSSISQTDLPELPCMDGTCPALSLHEKWYPTWEANHYFFREKANQQEDITSRDEPFVVMLPPPNITGSLHLGHALTATLQDILIRWQGMQGKDVLWVPGCDHAGIATQVVLEQHLLQTLGKNRHQLGQDEFLKAAWEWKERHEHRIYDQLRKLGVALNWHQAVFTMSDSMSNSVVEAFIRLYEKGLIYRKPRPVNYCCALQSVISDIEVDHWKVSGPTEVSVPGHEAPVVFGQMFDVAYPLETCPNSPTGLTEHIIVSTTRPETMPADTAIMVHPNDQRYAHLVGRRALNPCRPGDSLPIIADDAVDVKMGTGAVKVTPGLSATDYAVGQRHGLPVLDIMRPDGTLTCVQPVLQGVPRLAARRVVVSLLEEKGLLRVVRPHEQIIPRCSRTGDVVETFVQKQWFIRMCEMADRSLEAVESGELQLDPPSKRHAWTTWMRQTRNEDWCISRQIWWGHRVPVYQICPADNQPLAPPAGSADEDGHVWVAAVSQKEALQKAAHKLRRPEESLRAVQDPDVLDTWFSSALFPFAALGWPQRSSRLSRYYPTSVLVTGQDILFFWVARMVMLGTQLTGQLPFKRVHLHGLVCDSSGVKMSKSRGNVIDPMALIEVHSETSKLALSEQPRLGSSSDKSESNDVLGHRADTANAKSSKNLDAKVIDHSIRKNKPATNCKSQKHTGERRQLPVVGPDALRMSLMSTSPSSDHIEFGAREVEMFRTLPNKMWQSVKFLRQACSRAKCHQLLPLHQLADEPCVLDRWALHHTHRLVSACDAALNSCRLADLTEAFIFCWRSVLCDNFLEAVKPIISQCSSLDDTRSESQVSREQSDAMRSLSVMTECMKTALLCIAPVMPHLTEELYHCLPHVRGSPKKASIFAEAYPLQHQWQRWEDDALAAQVAAWLQVVSAVRHLKAAHDVSRKDVKATLYSACPHLTAVATCAELSSVACQLAQINHIELVLGDDSGVNIENSLYTPVAERSVLHLHVPGIDAEQQKARLDKRLQKLTRELSVAKKKERGNHDKIEKLSSELQQAQLIMKRLDALLVR